MLRSFFIWAIALLSFLGNKAIAHPFSVDSNTAKPWYGAYEKLHLPDLKNTTAKGVITVAVVDDGFNLDHRSIKNYIYHNKKEIPGNETDDDGNGYIDDINGWDAADNDNTTTIPEGREEYFYHGTMTAGIITMVAERCFGNSASEHIKIIPVKVMRDKSQKPNIDAGYEGIAYAIKQHPDIIVCAWSGGRYDSEKNRNMFEELRKQGILMLVSAGNFFSEQIDPPGNINGVYVVSALDTANRKFASSNYSAKVDLSCYGEFVYAPHPQKENTYGYNDGTSAAVALVTGCASVLKVLSPKARPAEIMAALKNTAIPVDSINRFYGGKLGAGRPDITAAVDYLQNEAHRSSFFDKRRPEGDIVIDNTDKRYQWHIEPAGGYKGFTFSLKGKWNAANDSIKFYSGDSLLGFQMPATFPGAVVIKGEKIRVQFDGKKGKEPSAISYSSIPIDSTTLYCSGIIKFEDASGEITDGSGGAEYANNSACKWQITVPQGKRVKITFDEFETQPKVDYVWMFDGDATLQENQLSQFSGPDLPPVIISRSNKVLVWFVTDKEITAKGWHLNYTATDEMPGVFPPMKK